MARPAFILILAIVTGCAAERIASSPVQLPVVSTKAASDSAYVAMCEHHPGVKIRLYGCTAKGYRNSVQPLIVLNGKSLPTDTAGRGKLRREKIMAALDPSTIESIQVFKRGDVEMLAKYGSTARNGVIVITLFERGKTTRFSGQPNTR